MGELVVSKPSCRVLFVRICPWFYVCMTITPTYEDRKLFLVYSKCMIIFTDIKYIIW
jgi:hypothetical protein